MSSQAPNATHWFPHQYLCTYQRQAWGRGGGGEVRHRVGILTFSDIIFLETIIKIPTPGRKRIVKISRNKWFTSLLLYKIERSRCIRASRSKITVEETLAEPESENTETWQKLHGHAIAAGEGLQEKLEDQRIGALSLLSRKR